MNTNVGVYNNKSLVYLLSTPYMYIHIYKFRLLMLEAYKKKLDFSLCFKERIFVVIFIIAYPFLKRLQIHQQ